VPPNVFFTEKIHCQNENEIVINNSEKKVKKIPRFEKRNIMNSKFIALTCLIIVIPILGAFAYPERYDRLPTWGWSHSQIGGGQDPAHQGSRENREDLCSHCFCNHLKAICDFKLNKTVSFGFDTAHNRSQTKAVFNIT